MEKKLQKVNFTYQNLLIAQKLWHVHCQVLSIIFLKEFIELNLNTEMLKNVKLLELNISIGTAFLNTKILNII